MVTDEKKKNTTDTFCLKTEKDNEKPTSKAGEYLMKNIRVREGGVCGEGWGALVYQYMDKRIRITRICHGRILYDLWRYGY